MAARGFRVETGAITVPATSKTLLQIRAPASFPIVLHQVFITLEEAATGEQPTFAVRQQDADGTAVGTLTPEEWGPIYGTIQSTAHYGPFSDAPTDDRMILPHVYLAPQGGYIWQGSEIIEPGQALGIVGSQTGGTAVVRIAAYCSE